MPNMAVTTSNYSSRADNCLQNSSPSYTLSSGHQYQDLSREISDQYAMSTPPALLPSGSINLPSYALSQSINCLRIKEMNTMRPVSTPVMHPKLVMTLKSIISQPFDNMRRSCSERVRGGGFDPLLDEYSTNLGKDVGIGAGYSLSVMKQEVIVPASEIDDDVEAAVVPISLIENRRPFKCAFSGCNKTFKNPQTMRMHHKTHYTDDSSYRQGPHAHVLSTLQTGYKAGHNKKIPSRCPKCKKTFVGLYELRRHYGRKHTEGEKSFGCKKCEKKFYIEVDLRDHEKLCGEPIECKCGMKFAFKCNLVAHKKGHPECQDPPSDMEPQQQKKAQQQKLEGSAGLPAVAPRPSPVMAETISSSAQPAFSPGYFHGGLEPAGVHTRNLWNNLNSMQMSYVESILL